MRTGEYFYLFFGYKKDKNIHNKNNIFPKMSELTNLIVRIQHGIINNASYVKTIRHPQLLVRSLKELNELIGNDKVKDSVATQVSHLIMLKRRALDSKVIKEDEVMLNTVLFGPPGVGKTLVGTKLAKIWYSLGYLDGTKNSKEKKQEIGEKIKDFFKDGTGTTDTDNSSLFIYIMFFFVMILITFMSMAWSFYNRFGGAFTIGLFLIMVVIIGYFAYYISKSMDDESNVNDQSKNKDEPQDMKKNKDQDKNNQGASDANSSRSECEDNCPKSENNCDYGNSPTLHYTPKDSDIIKVVTRADFVDRYVGWTSPKTIKLLEENLGKVLFVDEAYSLINGPHDEFGMEALTSLNLFLSQRPKEIIVIFAGYKDLLESGPYSVQPGLKRRFMWQFDCVGYNAKQLFSIFKLQLNKKGWGFKDDATILSIFEKNMDAFPAFGGDTERAAFFSELEHSRDFIANEADIQINVLKPEHIEKGIMKLRENNFKESPEESENPLANMMKLMSGKKNDLPQSVKDRVGSSMSR